MVENITIEIIAVGVFRNILKSFKAQYTFAVNVPTKVQDIIVLLDKQYEGHFSEELFLQDGSPNLWTRVLLNGRDIQFLPPEKQIVTSGDSLLFSSVMAGG